MRDLTTMEMVFVSGGEVTVSASTGTNGTNVSVEASGSTSDFGDGLINLYEGAVAATSHVIERVAEALK